MKPNLGELRNLPGVDKLLLLPEIKEMISRHHEDLVKYAIRSTLSHFRQQVMESESHS